LHNAGTTVDDGTPATGPDPWRRFGYVATRAAFVPPPFAMRDGETVVLDGAFVETAPKGFALDYRGGRFNALMQDAPAHDGDGARVSLELYHEPGAPAPARGAFATLLHLRVDADVRYADPGCVDPRCPLRTTLPGDYVGAFSYGNPFAGGQELVEAGLSFQTFRGDLPIGSDFFATGGIVVRAPAAELNGRPLEPAVGLPRDVKIGGRPAPVETVTAGVGVEPTLTFEAPALGTADAYNVSLIEVDDALGGAGEVVESADYTVAFFRVKATAVVVPPGVLRPGRHYYVKVAAVASPDPPPASLFELPLRRTTATTYTGVFTP
jgi:hypothetical protein